MHAIVRLEMLHRVTVAAARLSKRGHVKFAENVTDLVRPGDEAHRRRSRRSFSRTRRRRGMRRDDTGGLRVVLWPEGT